MADFELVMPKMGESIMEATILKWYKQVGDQVELDETIVEIATDKVDSEIPSPVAGKIMQLLFAEEDVVEVGKTIALIATEEAIEDPEKDIPVITEFKEETITESEPSQNGNTKLKYTASKKLPPVSDGRFYSPLVRKIAQEEGLTIDHLNAIEGTGLNGRVTKRDILAYLKEYSEPEVIKQPDAPEITPPPVKAAPIATTIQQQPSSGQEEIVEMDRMRKLIAEHMVRSVSTAPHVTSFVEADVTSLFDWRERNKESFLRIHGTKLTFTPIFVEAAVAAIADFPLINSSLDGDRIVMKKNVNVGMATALPSGNLIVPVIKDADDYSLVGLAKKVNDLAQRARENALQPFEVQGGTFTITNVGTFGNVMGTPIINQPQVAILAIGAIRKKPAVVETRFGDLIAIRKMMFLSLSYDHRIIDGFLGGSFLRRIADNLEQFDHEDFV